MASGDTAYIAPGTYREVVTVGITSPVAETFVLGDPANSQGFKDGSGVLLTAGDVTWTAYTTNNSTAPSATVLLNLSGRDFFTFKNLILIGGSANPTTIAAATSHSINIKFTNCLFISAGNNATISYTGLADVASNWIIDQCFFDNYASRAITVTLPLSATADYDTNFVVKNSIMVGSMATSFVRVDGSASGANAFYGGGIDILNCTFAHGSVPALATNSASLSTSIPCTIYNSLVLSTQVVGVTSILTGQILEDHNFLPGGRTNVTAGASSITTLYACQFETWQSVVTGRLTQPVMMPGILSPFLGMKAASAASALTIDAFNRPRPSGGNSASSAWGAFERHDFGTKGASSGSSVLTLLGPGDHDFLVPLDSGAASISAYGMYDSGHGAGSPPFLLITNGSEIGIADASAVMTGASGVWELLTVPVTAASAGVITARFVSRSAASGGNAYFRSASVK